MTPLLSTCFNRQKDSKSKKIGCRLPLLQTGLEPATFGWPANLKPEGLQLY